MISKRSLRLHPSTPIVLSVYFSGNNGSLTKENSLTSFLWQADTGFNLHHDNNSQTFDLNEHQEYKIGFNGCETDYGILGSIFGMGIDTQINIAFSKVKLLRSNFPSRRIVKVIIYGFSRGGVAALLFAKKLGHYPADLVEVNLALADPVPGNLIISAELDILRLTLAKQALDMTMCHNLARVFSLYTYTPLPDYYFHAPIRPLYPARTLVDEDFTYGEHTFIESKGKLHSLIVQPRFIQFLNECGTRFSRDFLKTAIRSPAEFEKTYDQLITEYKHLPKEKQTSTRYCHAVSENAYTIYFHPKKYFNRHHRAIKEDKITEESRISIQKIKPEIKHLQKLKNLSRDIYKNMSLISMRGQKGKLIRELSNQLDEIIKHGEGDKKRINQFTIQYLRLLVNIVLQRDRFCLSFFGSTRSGNHLKKLLLKPEYRDFANMMLGTIYRAPKYDDLISFAGGFDISHFNAWHRNPNFNVIENQLKSLSPDGH